MFFFRNSLSDQRLLLQALGLVGCVRLGLWVLPFRVVRQMVAKAISMANLDSAQPPPKDLQVMRTVASSIRRASRYVPAATCLTQALAAQILLARRGQISKLGIGVAKGEEGELKAHAWVESNGVIIIGRRNDLRAYSVLNHLEEVNQ